MRGTPCNKNKQICLDNVAAQPWKNRRPRVGDSEVYTKQCQVFVYKFEVWFARQDAINMPTAGKPYVRFVFFCVLLFVLGLGWGGVGGMLTFLVLRALYIAMLLRSLGSCATLHVATLLRSLVWVGVGVGWGGGAC